MAWHKFTANFTIVIIAVGLLGTLFIDWKYLRLGMLKRLQLHNRIAQCINGLKDILDKVLEN